MYLDIHSETASNAFVSLARKGLLVVFLGYYMSGCSGVASTKQSPPTIDDYVNYYLDPARQAIDRKDWQAAYRLLEDALVTEDPALRQKANNLVEKYPQIRGAAFTTFSKESFESTYRAHGDRAWVIEEERLSIFQLTLATPEEAAQGWRNFQDIYGEQIKKSQTAKKIRFDAMQAARKTDIEFEQEIQLALLPGTLAPMGDMQDLLKGFKVGQTLREQALARFGRPSRTFESNTILTWAVRVEGDNYSILVDFVRSHEGVTHSLVMSFDESLVLSEVAMVRVVK
jgi:hypothetical protein